MARSSQIRCLLLDIGGVLLTDGWGRHSRAKAVSKFGLDGAEMEDRHLLAWNTYQLGRLSLDAYLDRVVFYKERPFSREEFRAFVFTQTQPHPEMLDLIARLKAKYALKLCVVSNEGRDLNAYRIEHFGLAHVVDVFISSCFVGMLKPDVNMFRLALEVTQADPVQTAYIENTRMFVDIAQDLGVRGIWHRDYEATQSELASLGLA